MARARAHLKLGDRLQALADLEEAQRLQPDPSLADWMQEIRRG